MAAFNIKAKVATKGGISVYGLGQRWPVTLYRDQWEALAEKIQGVLVFAKDNAEECEKRAKAHSVSASGTTDDTGRVTL